MAVNVSLHSRNYRSQRIVLYRRGRTKSTFGVIHMNLDALRMVFLQQREVKMT